MSDTALVPAPSQVIDVGPLPAYGGTQMIEAYKAYRQLQQALDEAMPDQIMTLPDGKKFRKKGYWRAVSVAFNLTIEVISEERRVQGYFDDGSENFGYLVTVRAITKGGRSIAADGSCFAVEKGKRDAGRWAQQPLQATEHNVRGHAHTRACNRAISNLCGFGEVSAEEVERDDASPRPVAAPRAATPRTPSLPGPTISDPQRKRLWAIAKRAGWTEQTLEPWLVARGFEKSGADIPRPKYDAICDELNKGSQKPIAPPVKGPGPLDSELEGF